MPVQLSVQVRNAEIVKKRFEDLGAEIPKIAAGRLYGRLVSARKAVTRYPPPIPESRYKRTGRYGRAWQIVRVEGGDRTKAGYRLIGRAVSPKGRDYTKYVAGGARGEPQAKVHQGRWIPVRTAVEESVKGLPKEIQDNIVMVARRRGF